MWTAVKLALANMRLEWVHCYWRRIHQAARGWIRGIVAVKSMTSVMGVVEQVQYAFGAGCV